MFCLFVCLCVMFWLFIFKWKGTYTLRCSEIYLFSFPSTYTVSHNTQHTPWFCHLLFLLLTVPSLHPSLQGNIQRQKTLCLRHQPVIWKVKHISQENALAAFTWQKKKNDHHSILNVMYMQWQVTLLPTSSSGSHGKLVLVVLGYGTDTVQLGLN